MLQRLIADANYKGQPQNVEKTNKTKEKKWQAPFHNLKKKKNLGIHYLAKQKFKKQKKKQKRKKIGKCKIEISWIWPKFPEPEVHLGFEVRPKNLPPDAAHRVQSFPHVYEK